MEIFFSNALTFKQKLGQAENVCDLLQDISEIDVFSKERAGRNWLVHGQAIDQIVNNWSENDQLARMFHASSENNAENMSILLIIDGVSRLFGKFAQRLGQFSFSRSVVLDICRMRAA